MKMTFQPRQALEPPRDVARLRFDLLYANTIGCSGFNPGFQPFAAGRANAVEVEAGEFEQGCGHGAE